MKKVKVGLIGCGFISEIHARSLARVANSEVIACATPKGDRAIKFAKKYNIPKWFLDYKKLFEIDEINMIVIGAPNNIHAEITINAVKAGKHIVCEKPLCLNIAEADEMIDTCRKAFR